MLPKMLYSITNLNKIHVLSTPGYVSMNLSGQEMSSSTLLSLYITVCTYVLDLVLDIKDKSSQESNIKRHCPASRV